MQSRGLQLRREVLTQLTDTELEAVVVAADDGTLELVFATIQAATALATALSHCVTCVTCGISCVSC